ncbi:hypothetical protein AVEN_16233-1 [Araneus ventricosus]|uniref:Mos1 transposase HTH domain-containing protein n=1 Tax=Araneus ventricosus TaxID=182803 RepID=A0A4Y2SG88_ARAVE|nr:hypothetical protein AVEN_16233-1 [Araneus ventricosus]
MPEQTRQFSLFVNRREDVWAAQTPSTLEMRAVIRFCGQKGNCTEIYALHSVCENAIASSCRKVGCSRTVVKTSGQPQTPSKLEMRAVIRFLRQKGKLHLNLSAVARSVRENAISRLAVAKWYNMFQNGLPDVVDAYCEGRPSPSTNAEIVVA